MTSPTGNASRLLSLGRGRRSTRATRRTFGDAHEFALVLVGRTGHDAWWSPHAWRNDRRRADDWVAASAVVVDVDYYNVDDTHAAPPPDQTKAPFRVAEELGASACHPTPRGARLIWLLREATTERQAWIAAASALCDRLDEQFAGSGFRVDRSASIDTARIFWTPNATVDGVQRAAEVQTLGDEVDIADLLPDERHAGHEDVRSAVDAYRAAHPLDLPRSGGTCPLCGHNGCFGRLPTDPKRWFCFSDRHEADSGGAGVRGAHGWHGDVLDLDAHAQGLRRVDLLKRAGYLASSGSRGPSVGTPPAPSPVPRTLATESALPSVSSVGTSPAHSSVSRGKANNGDAPSVGSVSGPLGPCPEFRVFQPLPDPLATVPAFEPALLPRPFRRWIEDIAERIQCPIDFPAVAAMVAYSAVIGRRVGIRPKQNDDWLVVPNLWGGPVGRPGVMKTPGLQEPMSFLRRIESGAREAHEKAVRQHEAQLLIAKSRERARQKDIEAAIKDGKDPTDIAERTIAEQPVAPVRTRYITNDTTIEKLGELLRDNPTGILVFRDELTGLLRNLDKEGHEGARAFYLEAWNGTGAFTFDRIGRGTVEIPAAICSILGGIQPGPLTSYLKAAMRSGAGDDGLVQRFQLLVYPDICRDWKNVDQFPETAARTQAWEAFAAATRLNPLDRGAHIENDSIPFLRFAPDAQEAFDDWRASLEVIVRSGDEVPAIEAHLSKYRSLVPSLALLIHLAEGVVGAASRSAVEQAIAWVQYLEPHARRIYGLAVGNHLECRAIAKHILNGDLQDGFDARRIYRAGWAELGDPSAVECGLEELIQLGWLVEETRPTSGRSATVFRINPRIWETPPGGADRTDRSLPIAIVKQECSSEAPDRTDRSEGADCTAGTVGEEQGGEAADRCDRSSSAGLAPEDLR